MKIALWGLVKAGTAAYRAWTVNKVGRRLFPRWFERREERRRARRQEAEAAGVEGQYQYEEESPVITRTSSKAFIGGGLFSQIFVQLVALLPGEGAIELFLLKPETVAFAAVVFATIVARFSRTEPNPGAL